MSGHRQSERAIRGRRWAPESDAAGVASVLTWLLLMLLLVLPPPGCWGTFALRTPADIRPPFRNPNRNKLLQ